MLMVSVSAHVYKPCSLKPASTRTVPLLWQASVMEVRDKEAGILRRIIWWQALFIMLLFSGPVIMAVAVFAV